MHIRFDDRVALVTGAAQGIGRAIAMALQAAGAKVHLADIDEIAWARSDGAAEFVCHRADLGRRGEAHDLIDAVHGSAGRLD
ncbi:MAG TPA: SDR family NAD(P)-dependent oxidoreductase, partial [Hyphomicrobiaceae bacterium]